MRNWNANGNTQRGNPGPCIADVKTKTGAATEMTAEAEEWKKAAAISKAIGGEMKPKANRRESGHTRPSGNQSNPNFRRLQTLMSGS